MSLELTSNPSPEDEIKVVDGIRSFNRLHMPSDVEPLCVFDRIENGEIIAGLAGKTYWNYLEVSFLWVAESHRHQGRASAMMKAAEEEALRRGCRNILLDTYSFQALDFYEKLVFSKFGTLSDFSGEQTRYFLHKELQPAAGELDSTLFSEDLVATRRRILRFDENENPVHPQ
ncbi:GNAT family N-acetyltransferase [Verrucomicrobiales bacterium]|jgi:ribosomal protein S18 acetylase RimI-like enzyme|nr:GNAT family N-acetyltransferase [Verrucomicrobiales bacterium]|tara:strand:- start:93 stop:611 length:519 start_codon:yes stop_codon:yes gene_type:complete